MPSTIKLHRVFTASPERVYKAFTDPRALVKWMAPNGYVAEVHSIDVRAGGSYRMSFANLDTAAAHSFGGTYSEVSPGKSLKYTDKFEDPSMPGEMHMTVTFKKVSVGTELHIVQEGVPDMIPAEMCYLGWQESLALLKMLVEANVP